MITFVTHDANTLRTTYKHTRNTAERLEIKCKSCINWW